MLVHALTLMTSLHEVLSVVLAHWVCSLTYFAVFLILFIHIQGWCLTLDPDQECTKNPGCHIAWAATFFGSSVWNLLHVTILVPRVLRCLLYFWKLCEPLVMITFFHILSKSSFTYIVEAAYFYCRECQNYTINHTCVAVTHFWNFKVRNLEM
jgi:hypothetical protein